MQTLCKTATSALNPNAPLFVPSAYRSVEDFSDQWWDLVHSSPSFRDYWLRECFSDPQIDSLFLEITGEDVHDDDAVKDAVTKGKCISIIKYRLDSLESTHWFYASTDLNSIHCRERRVYGSGVAGVVEVAEAAWRSGDAEVLREGAQVREREDEPEAYSAAALE